MRNKSKYDLIPNLAKQQERPMASLLQDVLDRQLHQFVNYATGLMDAEKAVKHFEDAWTDQLVHAKGDWPLRMAVHGFKVAGALQGRKSYVEALAGKIDYGFQIDVDMFGADELVAKQLKPDITKWILATSKLETATTALDFQALFKKAMGTQDGRDSLTPMQMAQEMLTTGLAQNKNRAIMMSRTVTNWAYNEGAEMNYAEAGVEDKEWMTTKGDATCDLCAPMDGKRMGLGGDFLKEGESFTGNNGATMKAAFGIKHPPLHPNCRCTLIPVIVEPGDDWVEPKPSVQPPVEPTPETPQEPQLKPPGSIATPKPTHALTPPSAIDLPLEEAESAVDAYVRSILEEVQAEADKLREVAEQRMTVGSQMDKLSHRLYNDRALSPEEKVRVEGELNAACKRYKELSGSKETMAEAHRRILLEKLGVADAPSEDLKAYTAYLRSGSGKYEMSPAQVKAVKKKADEAADFLGKVTKGNPQVKERNVLINPHDTDVHNGRAFHRDHAGVFITTKDNVTTFVHEMGHELEEVSPQMRKRVKEWRNKRTAGENIIKLRDATKLNYDPSEVCLKDKFKDPYAGRVYKSGHTEILSMGAQQLYEDPVKFARQDYDYFRMTVAILRGWM